MRVALFVLIFTLGTALAAVVHLADTLPPDNVFELEPEPFIGTDSDPGGGPPAAAQPESGITEI